MKTKVLFAITLLFLLSESLLAQGLSYIDSSGNIHFANRLSEVPQQYREQVGYRDIAKEREKLLHGPPPVQASAEYQTQFKRWQQAELQKREQAKRQKEQEELRARREQERLTAIKLKEAEKQAKIRKRQIPTESKYVRPADRQFF